ncbi:MAG: glycoside hydrolase family 44 protein [Limisphaerales bacterium]
MAKNIFWSLKLLLLGGLFIAHGLHGQSVQVVYNDSLQNGWQNWSWATNNFNNANPVRSGTASISVTVSNWQAVYFHHSGLDGRLYTNISFWINGGSTGGQQLLIQGIASGQPQTYVQLPALAANTWQQFSVSLNSLGVGHRQDFDGFWIQDRIGTSQSTFYLDDIELIATSAPPSPTNTVANISIDAMRNRHRINDHIYGLSFATSNQLNDLNVTLNRSGGNAETRYNWELNANNRGFDWYFQSIGNNPTNAGGSADLFVRDTKGAGAEPMLTVPMMGWVAKLGPNRSKLASFSISKYGAQMENDWEWFPDAGNGILTNGTVITWNDPNDANVPTDSSFQQEWIQHLTNTWGPATSGGVRYYIMDNEPSLWHSTHRDVQKIGATMQEVRDKFFDYASKVKEVDPNALVLGPEEWGWSGYLYSGYDQQWGAQNGWNNLPDRAANGGWDYLPWFLNQVRQRAVATNQRLLDVFTVHYYPQGGEFNPLNDDLSTTMQLRRNRSTRSLWDTNYTDQSWIAAKVQLIPRLKNWVDTYYPDTPVGITEYNWGAEGHINGATAQADILGIFGRERLDMANRWTTPPTGSPAYNAIKIYRNYDGNKSSFGDQSVSAEGPNPDDVSTFAAVRTSDGALTLMVINKQLAGMQPVTVSFTNFLSTGSGEVWQLNSSNVIAQLPDITFTGTFFEQMLPAQSITLFVIQPHLVPRLEAFIAGGHANLRLQGQPGETYVIQRSLNLVSWEPIQTNTLNSSEAVLRSLYLQSPEAFYRAALFR